MQCKRCETQAAEDPGIRVRYAPGRPAEDLGPLKPLLCSDCGDVLPPQDSQGDRRRKLAQLARFGIVVGQRTLLQP